MHRLPSILQKAFDAISPKQHAALQNRWMAISPASVPDYRLLWKIVLPLIVVLVIVGCWALLLAREIRSRRRAEQPAHAQKSRTDEYELNPG